MSAEGSQGGINLRINNPVRPSLQTGFLAFAHALTYPVFSLKFKVTSGRPNGVVEIKLPQQVYDTIKQIHLTDEIPVVLPGGGPLAMWTYDMVIAVHMLSELGIINDLGRWILTAQQSMVRVVTNQKVMSKGKNKRGFNRAKEILVALDLIQVVDQTKLLFVTISDVIREQQMDPDTIIYKTALAVYHSKAMSGTALIPQLEDEGQLYVNMIGSEVYKKYQDKFTSMMDLPVEARQKTLRIFLAFVISAYAYYMETSREDS
jgi:hypothetical protein